MEAIVTSSSRSGSGTRSTKNLKEKNVQMEPHGIEKLENVHL